MIVEAAPDMVNWFVNVNVWHDPMHALVTHTMDGTVLAQQFNQDLIADMQKAFNHFVKSGQIWAFLLGIILGYMVKTFTTFG